MAKPKYYTPMLQINISRMLAHATDNRVGLLLRFNQNDNYTWTLFSESAGAPDAVGDNPREAERKLMGRPQAGAVDHRVGGHAEELLIANWYYYVQKAQAQTDNFKIRRVEIILSKSPCCGEDASGEMTIGTTQYDAGCAAKLAKFARDRQAIQWTIFYVQLAAFKTESSRFDKVPGAMELDPAMRRDHGAFYAQTNIPRGKRGNAIRGKVESALAKTRNFQAPPLTVDPTNIQQSKNVDHTQLGLRVRQALQGIGALNGLGNVTCEPFG